jgi:hypothetical protein
MILTIELKNKIYLDLVERYIKDTEYVLNGLTYYIKFTDAYLAHKMRDNLKVINQGKKVCDRPIRSIGFIQI